MRRQLPREASDLRDKQPIDGHIVDLCIGKALRLVLQVRKRADAKSDLRIYLRDENDNVAEPESQPQHGILLSGSASGAHRFECPVEKRSAEKRGAAVENEVEGEDELPKRSTQWDEQPERA